MNLKQKFYMMCGKSRLYLRRSSPTILCCVAAVGVVGTAIASAVPIDAAIFDGNCSSVIINDGENDELHENMELVQVTPVGEEYWFVLRDMTAAELEKIKMQSDIEYVAMMAGVEI